MLLVNTRILPILIPYKSIFIFSLESALSCAAVNALEGPNSSFVYFAFAGFPEIMLIKNMKDVIPLILNNLFIIFLNKQPINSGRPHLIKMFDNTKKGNNDGKMLFLKIFEEKSTAFNMLSDFVNISNSINIKIIMINMLVIFFTFAPLK